MEKPSLTARARARGGARLGGGRGGCTGRGCRQSGCVPTGLGVLVLSVAAVLLVVAEKHGRQAHAVAQAQLASGAADWCWSCGDWRGGGRGGSRWGDGGRRDGRWGVGGRDFCGRWQSCACALGTEVGVLVLAVAAVFLVVAYQRGREALAVAQ